MVKMLMSVKSILAAINKMNYKLNKFQIDTA